VASYKHVYRLKADDSPSPGAISIKTISAPVGSNVAQVVLGRTAGLGTAIAVEYRTVDNGAIAGRDYVASVGRLDWAAGDASDKTITIEILQNRSPTASIRSFFLQLAPASGGPVMLDQEATIWIEPSQPASPSPTPPPATTPPAPGSMSGQHSGGGGGGSSGPALLALLTLLLTCAGRRNLQLKFASQR
jgi:hypothetical protein